MQAIAEDLQHASPPIGPVGHPTETSLTLNSYDPKATPFRDIAKNMQPHFYKGRPGYHSAAVLADYVVVNMFASVCSGQATPQEAAAEAQRRAERYYKV